MTTTEVKSPQIDPKGRDAAQRLIALEHIRKARNIFSVLAAAEGLSTPSVDTACLLNSLTSELKDFLEGMKDRIKEDILLSNSLEMPGESFKAVLLASEVTRLKTEDVKKFLGKRLPDFQVTSLEHRLLFKPRT